MKTQHVFGASAAAVLVVSMAAFAQAPQSSQPSTQVGGSRDAQSSQQAQTSKQPETPVTLVGCVMRETDYRKANDSGRGGPIATGLGVGNEFVLVNAKKATAGETRAAASTDCSSATPGGESYELSGSREKELAQYVGRAVEISGTLKAAGTQPGAAGEPKPTGGFDPLKQDLKLFEVDVASFRPVASSQSAAAPATAAPAPEPAPAAPAPQPSPRASAQSPAPAAPATPPSQQSASAASRQNLPRTASPLPVTALFGLLSLATGLVLRRRE